MQRCGAHLASKVDVEEAFNAGRESVKGTVFSVCAASSNGIAL